MMVTETGELNGHVLTGESHPEQFVRADDAWFREIWKTTEDVQLGSLTSVLCRFNDGTGFYSVSLKDPDAQSGSVSGWYDANGTRQAMSQFIQVSPSKKENLWRIHSQSPSLDLVLLSPIHHANGVAGFVEGSKKQGFCVVNKE